MVGLEMKSSTFPPWFTTYKITTELYFQLSTGGCQGVHLLNGDSLAPRQRSRDAGPKLDGR